MKQKIPFSPFCTIITLASVVLLAVAIVAAYKEEDKFILMAAIACVVILSVLFYCPLSVSVADGAVCVRRPLKTKKLPLAEIKSVETFYPSAGGLRLCGSGGLAGYWGYFSDIMCGSYFGYYGRRDSCILVKMTDGKQYVIGCENPKKMVEYIESLLK